MPKGNGDTSSYAPFGLYANGGVDAALDALLRGAAQRQDAYINEIMTGHMFQDPDKGTL